jgi:uncharacterized integral membrane protein
MEKIVGFSPSTSKKKSKVSTLLSGLFLQVILILLPHLCLFAVLLSTIYELSLFIYFFNFPSSLSMLCACVFLFIFGNFYVNSGN